MCIDPWRFLNSAHSKDQLAEKPEEAAPALPGAVQREGGELAKQQAFPGGKKKREEQRAVNDRFWHGFGSLKCRLTSKPRWTIRPTDAPDPEPRNPHSNSQLLPRRRTPQVTSTE